MQTALSLDVGQKSAHRDKGAKHMALESNDPITAAAAPTIFWRADYDGAESSITCAAGEAET